MLVVFAVVALQSYLCLISNVNVNTDGAFLLRQITIMEKIIIYSVHIIQITGLRYILYYYYYYILYEI